MYAGFHTKKMKTKLLSDEKVMRLFDIINTRVWNALVEKKIPMSQIFYVIGRKEIIPLRGELAEERLGTTEGIKGNTAFRIRVYKKSHESIRELLDTLCHELAHYYTDFCAISTGSWSTDEHCIIWQTTLLRILGEPGIWKGIQNQYIPTEEIENEK